MRVVRRECVVKEGDVTSQPWPGTLDSGVSMDHGSRRIVLAIPLIDWSHRCVPAACVSSSPSLVRYPPALHTSPSPTL